MVAAVAVVLLSFLGVVVVAAVRSRNHCDDPDDQARGADGGSDDRSGPQRDRR